MIIPIWVLLVCAVVGAALTVLGFRAVQADRRAATKLEQMVEHERRLSASLELVVATRTSELEDAQRALQRMWWLGQQITLELNPQRVLQRFLEAVTDMAHADGAVIGLLGDEGSVHI